MGTTEIIADLTKAITEKDETAMMANGLLLLGEYISSQARIAAALEKIADQ